ncbi:MAG: hypothetical protein NZ602_03960 [Thermoguttaceae bacterium]|nr:hypothetical protein [Thermoguttaceae bacterium]
MWGANIPCFGQSGAKEVQKALDGLHQWLDQSPYKDGWLEYLQISRLEKELVKPTEVNPEVLAQVLARYYTEAEGLELAPFVRVREAISDWLTEITGNSWQGLARQAKASQKAFVPFSPQTARRVHAQLKAAVAALDQRLRLAGPNGDDWRQYLGWQELVEQLNRGQQADLERLDAIYYRLDAGFEGLGLYWFSDVRQALHDWLIILRTTDLTELEANYRTVLDTLAKELESLPPTPTAEQTERIGAILNWLRDARQAPWLVKSIRRRFGQTNLKAEISAPLVQAALDRQVEDVSPVVDWILGTEIHGTGRTKGRITSSLIPNSHAVEMLLHFTGRTESETVGYNGPARIYANGQTQLQAWKRLLVMPDGLQVAPAQAQADTQTTIRGIGLVRGGCVVERIAWKRTFRTKPTAEWIAARHAEDRLRCRLDQQIEQLVAERNREFQERIRLPLWERRLWPPEIQLRSTDRSIGLEVCQAQAVQLAAPLAPPACRISADLVLHVHETMVNNTAALGLSGMILTDEHFDRASQQPGLFGQLFQQAPTKPEGEPWAIYFAHEQPVFVAFRDGRFTITIHGRAFRRGQTKYPGMNITAEYRIEKSPAGYRAVRVEELKIFPPDWEPGRQLSVQEQVLKDLLQRRFEKIFPPEMTPKPIELPETWPGRGHLELVLWESDDGWLSLAWRRNAAVSTTGSAEMGAQ